MSENETFNNNTFCLHQKMQKENIIYNISYSYCEKCGSISIKHKNNYYSTIKPKQKQKSVELNPILIVQNMIKNQDLSYPNLKNIYNLDIRDNTKKMKDKIEIYFFKRRLILQYLQNITRKMNYSDLSFYHCLLFIDLFFCHNITEEMDEEEFLYIIIGFFLITSKFKETDIYEPELFNFNNIDTNINLSIRKILNYETKLLKYINYNFFIYSTYDWINIFINNGYIFEEEIDNDQDYINEIQTYTYRLLIIITPKNIFIKYSPLYMAISVIQIAREDKIEENKINNELFQKLLTLYNIHFEEYKDCYREIKAIVNEEKNINHNIKLQNKKINTSRNRTPILKKIENNKLLNEKMNIETLNKIKMNQQNTNLKPQSKLNLMKKIKEGKIKKQLINLNSSIKTKKNFHSIIVNNMNNNKNRNFNIHNKNIEIIEYINSNLPGIYKNGIEPNKIFKTEGETINGQNYQIEKYKNGTLNNFSYKSKMLRNKIVSSVDNRNLKKINIYKYKNKSNISPLKLNKFMKNGTYETLVENDKKFSQFLYKNNKNIFHTENNSSILNKSGDYLKNYQDTSNNLSKINDKNANLIIKNYITKNNNKIIINNNINVYKNYSNIYKNNIKPLYRENTSDYIGGNNSSNIKQNIPKFLNRTKDIEEIYNKRRNNLEILNSSIEKNKEKEYNIMTSRNNNNVKLFLGNIKKEQNYFINTKDLLFLKKSFHDNTKLPKLKIKMDK